MLMYVVTLALLLLEYPVLFIHSYYLHVSVRVFFLLVGAWECVDFGRGCCAFVAMQHGMCAKPAQVSIVGAGVCALVCWLCATLSLRGKRRPSLPSPQ